MSDQRHTQGPWEVMNGTDIFGPLGGDSGDGAKADPNDGWQVAEVGSYWTFHDGELTELGEDCRKANARLIAAAPDLLEALKNAVSYAENMDYDFDHAFWGEIRGAIAKAEENQ